MIAARLPALFSMRDALPPPAAPDDAADRSRTAADNQPRSSWVSRPMSEAARAILDDGRQWEAERAPARVGDQMIHPHTQAWLRSLPGSRWPMNLASRFPRVANHLALVWPDRVLCDRAFERLMNDDRAGRQGFPPPVQAELMALKRLRTEQDMAASPASPWGGLRLAEAPGRPKGRDAVRPTDRDPSPHRN